MEIRYYRDPETGLLHIHEHGVTEAEAELILAHPARTKPVLAAPGRRSGRRQMGDTCASFTSPMKKGTGYL